MSVKQISVLIENTPGKLAELTQLLADNHIDLISLCIADTTHYGIARAIIGEYEKTSELLQKNGYTVKVTDVIAALIPDRPGGLVEVLSLFSQNEIALEYLYSAVRGCRGKAAIILRVDRLNRAQEVLCSNGVEQLTQADLRNL